MDEKFSIGDIVLSKAGRDAGKHFVIVKRDGNFAHIANGKLHKIEKPKKKKLKHIAKTNCTYEQLMGVQFEKEKITNPKLKKTIFRFHSTGF